MGTQPPWSFLQKVASSTFASISYLLFFSAKILVQCIFDSYGVLGTQKTPSICFFRSLMFFHSEKLSWIGIRHDWNFRFRKFGLDGDSATVVLFAKRSVFHVC